MRELQLWRAEWRLARDSHKHNQGFLAIDGMEHQALARLVQELETPEDDSPAPELVITKTEHLGWVYVE